MNIDETLSYIDKAGDDTLFILWTNADETAAKLMLFMYAENSIKQAMWKDIMIIVWGATTKLVAESEAMQAEIKRLKDLGVKFSACVTCAKELGVEEKIEALGIDLIKWLKPLTAVIKGGKKMLTV